MRYLTLLLLLFSKVSLASVAADQAVAKFCNRTTLICGNFNSSTKELTFSKEGVQSAIVFDDEIIAAVNQVSSIFTRSSQEAKQSAPSWLNEEDKQRWINLDTDYRNSKKIAGWCVKASTTCLMVAVFSKFDKWGKIATLACSAAVQSCLIDSADFQSELKGEMSKLEERSRKNYEEFRSFLEKKHDKKISTGRAGGFGGGPIGGGGAGGFGGGGGGTTVCSGPTFIGSSHNGNTTHGHVKAGVCVSF